MKALDNGHNRDVLAYLSGQSAHGDVAEALLSAAEHLGDFDKFCPDASQYLCVAIHTKGIVFGYAVGMNTVAFRLGPEDLARALATGGHAVPTLAGWASFELFRSDWPAVDTRFWATRAYVHAREP